MSFNDVYEFIQGEYQQVTRIRQEPVSTADPVFFKDLNLVKWAGYANEIWSAETGGTQLVQGLDYELQYLDVAASGPAGEPVYSGYSILTPLYYNIPLFQTANIVGAYTQRPYRPSYNVITTDTTVTPVSMDDSVIADASAGNIIIKLEDGFHLNQRYSIVCKGTGTVTVGGTGIGAGAAFQGVGVSWLWDGGEWMPLAAPGAREGGFYYDYVPAFIRPDTDPISATIPNFLATYGEGFFYIGLEFTYNGVTDKTNGTFAIADDDIDKYAVLAVDVAGGDSTLSIQWQWATDTMIAIETGTDFTDLNLWAVFRWEKVTYGGYGAWANTAEAPTYGEPIVSGQELYLDGTKEYVSSDGNAPVVDVVDYLPAVINVDGVETPEENSKWPGQRGAYGFFGEYENVTTDYTLVNSALATTEGDWLKVENTVASGRVRFSFTALATNGYFYVLARKGTADISVVNSTGNVGATITWATKDISITGIDLGAIFISDDIVLIALSDTVIGDTQLQLWANDSTGTGGEYTYYRDWMAVDLPYAVPYVAGTHQPAKLQFNKDWSESAEWTIQGWAMLPTDPQVSFETLAMVGDSNEQNYYKIDINSSGRLRLASALAGSVNSVISDTPIIENIWFHWKVTFGPSSKTVHLNGAMASNAAATPDTSIISKVFSYSSDSNKGVRFNGYIQDVVPQPGIDESDAHYLSGLPYYNPNKTYGKNASWSIDARGNISGNNQVAGGIIFDGEINGQWVTRWDTGRMEISGRDESASAPPITLTFAVPFIDDQYSMSVTTYTNTSRTANAGTPTATGCLLYRWNPATGDSTNGTIIYIAVGRWK